MSVQYIQNYSQAQKAINDEINNALEMIGRMVSTQASANSPVLTGQLRDSITYKTNTNEKQVTIGTNVEYALAVHEGDVRHKGKPYLKDAVEQNKAEIQNIIKSTLGRIG